MLKNTTFNLPEELVARAKAYAAAHGATMTSTPVLRMAFFANPNYKDRSLGLN